MTMKIPTALSTVLAYVKKYWSLVALLAGAVIAAFVFQKQGASVADKLKRVNADHDEELRKINVAREEERLQRLVNEEKLKDTLAEVQSHYDAAKKDLDSKKKKEIERLVRQHSGDPVALAKKLSDATGFKVLLPTD